MSRPWPAVVEAGAAKPRSRDRTPSPARQIASDIADAGAKMDAEFIHTHPNPAATLTHTQPSSRGLSQLRGGRRRHVLPPQVWCVRRGVHLVHLEWRGHGLRLTVLRRLRACQRRCQRALPGLAPSFGGRGNGGRSLTAATHRCVRVCSLLT